MPDPPPAGQPPAGQDPAGQDPSGQRVAGREGPGLAPGDTFAADLFRVLAARPGGLVFSPASIGAALRLALLGARGPTAAELAAVLHLAGPQEAAAGLRLLGQIAGGAASPVEFRAPNTMWLQAGLTVRESFASAVTGAGGATVRHADFAGHPEQARQAINELIAGQTAGKITGLMGRGAVGAATRLVLASAVYLKAAWEHPFPPGATSDGPFHRADGTTVTAAMMHLTAQLGYVRGRSWQAVLLPYRGRRLTLAVVLPDGPPAEPQDAPAGLTGLAAAARPAEVRLSLPRFRLTARSSLVEALRSLGLARPFGTAADFGGIAPGGLAIGAVEHQAYLDVDEEGTEAAAATGVAIAMVAFRQPGPAIEVIVDRPFLFAILDTVTGLPLFLGRLTDPAAG